MPERIRPLTETQRQAHGALTEAVATAPQGTVIYLEGLRGTGKSLVINAAQPELRTARAKVKEEFGGDLRLTKPGAALDKMLDGIIVAFGSPIDRWALEEYLGKNYPNTRLVSQILPGMALPESVNFVEASQTTPMKNMTNEDVARSALGVPLLIEQLTSDSGLTSEAATRIAGTHLGKDLMPVYHEDGIDEASGRYLQIPPSVAILDAAKEYSFWSRGNHIYHTAGEVLERMKKLRTEGVAEESPFFVAPESVEIYNRMLKAGRAHAAVEIFAPILPEADLRRAAQALGVSEFLEGGWGPNISYADREATRVKMFGQIAMSGYRKTAIWLKEADGEEHVIQTENEHANQSAQAAEKRFLSGKLPIAPTRARNAKLYVHKHMHPEEVGEVAIFGWMVESMLQQREIPYLVHNATLNQTYAYRPETQKIEYSEFDITDYWVR